MLKIVGICSVPQAFVHMYMAEASLKMEAINLGIDIKIEIECIDGIHNKISFEELDNASAIIHISQNGETLDRLNKYNVYNISLSEALYKSREILKKIKQDIIKNNS